MLHILRLPTLTLRLNFFFFFFSSPFCLTMQFIEQYCNKSDLLCSPFHVARWVV